MAFEYDTNRGLLMTAMTVTNTVIPQVVVSLELWLFLAVHMVVLLFRRSFNEEVEAAANIDWKALEIVSGMTTFFEVFYANQSYARYLKLYGKTKDAFTLTHDVVHLLRVYGDEAGMQFSRLSARYVVLSLRLLISQCQGRDFEETLQELLVNGYAKANEVDILREHERSCECSSSVIAGIWCSNAADKAFAASGESQTIFRFVVDKLMKLQGLQRDIACTVAFPTPFQHFHLLSSMVIMCLLLWAVVLGNTGHFFAPVIYFFASLIFIGMIDLSSALADPFGDDDVDFPLQDWMENSANLVEALLAMDVPSEGHSIEKFANDEPRFAVDLRGLHL